MRQNVRFGILAVCVLVFVAFVVAPVVYGAQPAAPKKAGPEKVTITGTVTEVKDAKGKVTHVSIATDQGDFLVLKKGKGKELLKLANKKVEATGTVKEVKGKKHITVSAYKVVE
jgi:Rieske Fe-S protein